MLETIVVIVNFIIWIPIWTFLFLSAHHAWIAVKAFEMYPTGTMWKPEYLGEKNKFFGNFWYNISHPKRTWHGWENVYYKVGRVGFVPTGEIKRFD